DAGRGSFYHCGRRGRLQGGRDRRRRRLWLRVAKWFRLKFVVDGMLGGLARSLRMLGYVTEYDSKADDNILLRNSQTPDTVLLTRDEELYNRALAKSIRSVLVLGDTEEAGLGQL